MKTPLFLALVSACHAIPVTLTWQPVNPNDQAAEVVVYEITVKGTFAVASVPADSTEATINVYPGAHTYAIGTRGPLGNSPLSTTATITITTGTGPAPDAQ